MNKISIATNAKTSGIRVKSGVKAGAFGPNHNAVPKTSGIRVKSGVKAGAFGPNHNAAPKTSAIAV